MLKKRCVISLSSNIFLCKFDFQMRVKTKVYSYFFFLLRSDKNSNWQKRICKIAKNIVNLPAPFLSFRSSSAIKRSSLNRRRWFGDAVWRAVVEVAAAAFIVILPNNPNTINRRNDIVSQHRHIINIIWPMLFRWYALPFSVIRCVAFFIYFTRVRLPRCTRFVLFLFLFCSLQFLFFIFFSIKIRFRLCRRCRFALVVWSPNFGPMAFSLPIYSPLLLYRCLVVVVFVAKSVK